MAIFDPAGFFSQPLSVGTHTIHRGLQRRQHLRRHRPRSRRSSPSGEPGDHVLHPGGEHAPPRSPASRSRSPRLSCRSARGRASRAVTAIFTLDTRAPVERDQHRRDARDRRPGDAQPCRPGPDRAEQPVRSASTESGSSTRATPTSWASTPPATSSSTSSRGTPTSRWRPTRCPPPTARPSPSPRRCPARCVPSGTVSFYNGPISQTNLIGPPVTLDANGQATINTAALTAGPHTITVFYSGNTSYNSGSTTFPYTVNPATTETALTSSASTTAYGQTLTLTASLSVDAPGQGTPGGTVTFFDTTGTTPVQLGNPAVVNSAGVAVFRSPRSASARTRISADVQRQYHNNNFAVSTSNTLNADRRGRRVVVAAKSSATLNQAGVRPDAQPHRDGQGHGPRRPRPPDGEEVDFLGRAGRPGSLSDSQTRQSTAPPVTAVLTGVTGLSVGTHVISASYVGDISSGGSFLANTGQFTPRRSAGTPRRRRSTSSGRDTPVPTSAGHHLHRHRHRQLPGSGTPTGTVNFYDGPARDDEVSSGSNTLSGGVRDDSTPPPSAPAATPSTRSMPTTRIRPEHRDGHPDRSTRITRPRP